MRLVLIERSLGAPERAIVLFPVLLHNALQRTVGYVCVARSRQKQVGEYSSEPAVAVLKRVDCKKSDDKNGDDEKRMMAASAKLAVRPRNQFLHQPRRVKRRCGFKDHAHTSAMLVEGLHVIWRHLVAPAMVLVSM